MNNLLCERSRISWTRLAVLLVGMCICPLFAQNATNSSADTTTNTPQRRAASPRRPSIVLIFADNIGYGDLSCYGQTKVRTPNLDRLATNGIRFTSFYTGSPSDEPARASLLTGLEPRHVGAGLSHPLPMDAFTIAEYLKQLGYRTGFMGEWNLGDTTPVKPNAKGFDQFVGYLNQNHARDYFTDTIYRQDPSSHFDDLEMLADLGDTKGPRFAPDVLGKAAGNFLRINRPTRVNNYRPFFLCVSYPIPHLGPVLTNSPYASESWPVAQKARAALIARMDENIGTILDQLAGLKMDTNTIVLFTSIGGPRAEGTMDVNFFASTGRLRGQAGTVYEGGIRVPMIARWPAAIKPNQTSDFVWAAWDLFPTFAEIALGKPPERTDGISALAAFGGEKPKQQHESFYWQSNENGLHQAVRSGDWKLVRNGTNTLELYNLATDIAEKTNVLEKNSEVVLRLQKVLDAAAAK